MKFKLFFNDQEVYNVILETLMEKIDLPNITPVNERVTEIRFDDREENFVTVKAYMGKKLWKEKHYNKGDIIDYRIAYFDYEVLA